MYLDFPFANLGSTSLQFWQKVEKSEGASQTTPESLQIKDSNKNPKPDFQQ